MANTWVPVARLDTPALAAGATTAGPLPLEPQTIGWIGSNLAEGEVCGVSVTTDGAALAGHFVRVRLFTETALTNLMYDTTISLETSTSGTDTLAMPIPLFAQKVEGTPSAYVPSVHSYTVENIAGGGVARTYQVLFFIRATT